MVPNAHNIQAADIPNARRYVTKNVQDVGGADAGTTTYEVLSGVPQGTATIATITTDRQIIVQQHS